MPTTALTIHEFLESCVLHLSRMNEVHRAAALQELLETHEEGFGRRTDLRMPRYRWWWSDRMRMAHFTDGYGPVCMFCSEVRQGTRTADGYPCPVLMGAAEEFRSLPGWQESWLMNWADWG